MKRADLERHLHDHGCRFLREGGKHSIWWNPVTRKVSSIPRHREINDFTARKICRDLEIPSPQDVHGQSRFVEATRGVFWLRANSPAIGKGSPEHAPARDFWGRSRPKDRPPDVAAFPHVPDLEKAETRADWDHGWAYHRHGQKTNVLPDLWTLP